MTQSPSPSGRKPTSATRRSRKSTTPPVLPVPPVPCELDASEGHDIARPAESDAAQPMANDAVRTEENKTARPEEAIAQSNLDTSPATDWQSVASFTLTVQRRVIDQRIDYQTVVHDIALDQTTTWSSVETTQLQDWITSYLMPPDTAQQAHVPPLAEPLSSPLSEPLSSSHPLAIQIHQLQIIQPPHSQTSSQANGHTSSQANGQASSQANGQTPMVVDRVNQAFLNSLQSQQPFSLTAEFELVGATEISPTASFSYMAQVFARHRSTGHIIPLSRVVATEWIGQNGLGQNGLGQNGLGQNSLGQNSLGQNSLGQNSLGQNSLGQNSLGQNSLGQNSLGQNGLGQTRRYHASFPEIAIAEAGLYRLQVLVSLQQIKASSGYFEVPVLQVV